MLKAIWLQVFKDPVFGNGWFQAGSAAKAKQKGPKKGQEKGF